MERRRHTEDHENLDRWLVSYADFITLLFAFFVVMYAISSVNEGKYRVFSESLITAFRSIAPQTQVQGPVQQLVPAVKPVAPSTKEPQQQRREKMGRIAAEVRAKMDALVRTGRVRVIEGEQGISIEIDASVLFPSGSAQLDPASRRLMSDVARSLAGNDLQVSIEGHTDNAPINTSLFPSNWELSAVRATTVLRVFTESGVKPENLSAVGYGEFKPLESNDSESGRARNRRVAIQVKALGEEEVSRAMGQERGQERGREATQ